MFRTASPILPNVPIFTLEWGLGEQFGGLTNSVLQRTNSFADLARRRMTLLTVEPEAEPKSRARQLQAEGRLSKRVSVKNLWDELRSMPDRKLQRLHGNVELVTDQPVADPLTKPDDQYRRDHEDSNGKVIRTDYFRKDGSLLASDRRDWEVDGRPARRITVHTRRGIPVAQWSNMSEFYFSWIDSVVGTDMCILITDTGGIGGRMRTYHRDNVVKVQMLHNLHLAADAEDINGSLDPIWKNVMVNSDNYDVLGVLTEDQKRDIAKTQLDPGNLKLLSNMYQGEVLDIIEPRPRAVGIQVSRLSQQKRVDHTIRAIAKSNSATIDVYGFAHNPDHEQWLNDLIDEMDIGNRVRLKGYDPQARSKFKDASFSLLPSLYEGQGLVLIESMAAGCIPIAYDVRYGPSSIIEHGVDGFLVPAGNVDALAAMIDYVTTLDDETLAGMRRSATQKARRYLPERIVEHWGQVLHDAVESKPEAPAGSGKVVATAVAINDENITIKAKISGVSDLDEEAAFAWKSRAGNLYGRVAARCSADGKGFLVEGQILVGRLDRGEKNIFDLFVDVRSNGYPLRMRIKSTGLDVPEPAGNLEPYSTANANLSVKSLPANH